MGVSENGVPLNPMVLLIIILIKWLFHWEYTQFSDKPIWKYVRKPWERPPPTSPTKQFATVEHPNLLETISWVLVVPSAISQGGGRPIRSDFNST